MTDLARMTKFSGPAALAVFLAGAAPMVPAADSSSHHHGHAAESNDPHAGHAQAPDPAAAQDSHAHHHGHAADAKDSHSHDGHAAESEDPHAGHAQAPDPTAAQDPHAHHGSAAGGSDPHARHREVLAMPRPDTAHPVDLTVYEVDLVNQHGATVNFARDVIGDKVIIMDFVYTTCTTVCPVLSAVFTKLQDRLSDRLGSDVFMVSVSVDPTTDTPARLRAFAAKHEARAGWDWLTGEKRAVEKVLTGLGAYTPDFTQHPVMVLVGDGGTGEWRRFYGFPNPDQVAAQVETLLASRTHNHAAVTGHSH